MAGKKPLYRGGFTRGKMTGQNLLKLAANQEVLTRKQLAKKVQAKKF